MHCHTEHARPNTTGSRPLSRTIGTIASIVVGLVTTLAVLAPAGGAAASTAPAGTAAVVSSESSPFGTVLMVGSGPFAGYSLYAFSRNTPAACTATTITVQNMPLSCAGPESDKTADWPVLTTVGKPVAGPGVDKHLLGVVYRKDIKADQVTYAGKLLYLFDMAPHMFTGANFMETVLPLPPWHGLWYLVSAGGQPAVGSIAVTTQAVPNGPSVLAADMFQGTGSGTPIVVYTYSKDKKGHSACTAACALSWPPVLTTAPPQAAWAAGGHARGGEAGRRHRASHLPGQAAVLLRLRGAAAEPRKRYAAQSGHDRNGERKGCPGPVRWELLLGAGAHGVSGLRAGTHRRATGPPGARSLASRSAC